MGRWLESPSNIRLLNQRPAIQHPDGRYLQFLLFIVFKGRVFLIDILDGTAIRTLLVSRQRPAFNTNACLNCLSIMDTLVFIIYGAKGTWRIWPFKEAERAI